MSCTRRELCAGITTGLVLGGTLGEVRAQQASAGNTTARILFDENPLGPSPKALAAIESAATDLGRYPLGQTPQLWAALKQRYGLSYKAVEPGRSRLSKRKHSSF